MPLRDHVYERILVWMYVRKVYHYAKNLFSHQLKQFLRSVSTHAGTIPEYSYGAYGHSLMPDPEYPLCTECEM